MLGVQGYMGVRWDKKVMSNGQGCMSMVRSRER